MKHIGLPVLAAAAMMLFAGCNTMSGVGKDIERGGEKLQGSAERNKYSRSHAAAHRGSGRCAAVSAGARAEVIMLSWAVTFFVVAILAALLGFTGIAAGAAEIAKILFFVFLVLFLVSLVVSVLRR